MYPTLVNVHLTKKIYVKNVSPQATVDVIVDFFSYCGTVQHAFLYKDVMDLQCATVFFESKDAATTGLLLSGAMIYDRCIEVEQLSPEKEKELKQRKEAGKSDAKPAKISSEANSKSSVVASLLAAGYNVGSNVMNKAKTYDQSHWQCTNYSNFLLHLHSVQYVQYRERNSQRKIQRLGQ